MKYYSVDNAVMIRNQKRYQKVYVDGDAETNVWTQQMIEEMVQPLKRMFSKVKGTYGPEGTEYVYRKLTEMELAVKRVLIIGSQLPWVGSICCPLEPSM